jgi:hypothetical protein
VVRASNVYSALAVFVLFLHELFIVWVGCKARVNTDEVDRFQLDDVHFCFVYQSTALDESDFLKAIYLELKTDNTEEIKQKILDFGVRKLDVPDPHLYFRLQGDRCLCSWVSAKTSLGMKGHLHQDLDRRVGIVNA